MAEQRRARVPVAKTYKLYVGGQFPRSESGRSYPVSDAKGRFLANAAHASRKDVRDAVVAARKAFPGWAGATAYNRGQVLYRVAEMLEGRREQFAAEVAASEGISGGKAQSVVDTAVDRWVWYAGWTDKIATVLGAANPVAGPYFSFTVPEPTGVVGVLAPQRSSLLGLVSVLAPALASGCTAVVVSSAQRPLPAITLSEVLATSDVPAGVVNVLTGRADELGPWLASHGDVDALDPTGAGAEARTELAREAAGTVKRVLTVPAGEPDWTERPDIARLRRYLEPKTVWHPMGG
ncbi:aldehyde dehydrogenase family protein [Qaidamihabitans albus]|uniref:aldehyde dehydrogenase family protein n=1 Tax=Qaidamihabitans albus TaxID=2795733 RepID=UPI0018F1F25F|nr:aldehyde dehydrogenase family protein [Qaidamihabitans albus]